MSRQDSTTTVVGRARDLARRIRELASAANSQEQGIIAQLILEELAAPVVLLAGVQLEVAVFEMLEREIIRLALAACANDRQSTAHRIGAPIDYLRFILNYRHRNSIERRPAPALPPTQKRRPPARVIRLADWRK